jgi:choline-sulfatase
MPHNTWSVSNENRFKNGVVTEDVPSVGSLFSAAGYECIHFGKRHDNGALHGFNCIDVNGIKFEPIHPAYSLNYDSFNDEDTTRKSVNYLSQTHDKPFVMAVDIQNPHDICSWIGCFQGEHEDLTGPDKLPELLENYIVDFSQLPKSVQYSCCAHRRQQHASLWNDMNFRHYLAAYYHYVHMADDCIGRLLDALKASDSADDTLIVFMADHGDSMGSRKMVTKHTSFYEETTNVPMIFAGAGVSGQNQCFDELVSNTDLMPTLCELAGIDCPTNIYGKSLAPLLKGEKLKEGRTYVASEWMSEWGFTIEPGRMIRSKNFKYNHFLENSDEELYDLVNDPYEKINLAGDNNYADVLEEHRAMLDEHVALTADPFFYLAVKADDRWRNHAPGFHNHRGISAPDS